MLKKSLATALLVCSVPALANAWFFTTQVKSAGGSIASKNKAVQTVANGAIFKSYTATEANPNYPASAVVTPAAGYTIKSIVVNGGTPIVPADPTVAYTQNFTGSADRSITALFQANSYTVTAKVADGGASVTPTKVSNIYQGTALAADLKFTFIPKAGFNIVSVSGVTAGALVTIDPVPAAVNTPVVVTFKKGYAFSNGFTLGAVTANGTPRINPIAPVTFGGYAPATLTATANAVPGAVFTWTYVSGPQDTFVVDPLNAAKQIVKPLPAVPGFALQADGSYQFTGASFGYTPAVNGTFKFVVTTPNPDNTKPALSAAAVILNPAASAGICSNCHIANQVGGAGAAQAIATAYAGSIHSQSAHSACEACHYGTGNGGHPGTISKLSVDPSTFKVLANDGVIGGSNVLVAKGDVICIACHKGSYPIPHPINVNAGVSCAKCHTDATGANAGTGDAHSIKALPKCIECHAIAQAQVAPSLVNDNNGVRAIIPEFTTKRSHHITGAAPTDAQCAVCHMEGKASNGEIVVDSAYHMKNANIYLRNADGGAPFVWDGADHTAMDNFCFSCHDADGFNDAATLTALLPAATNKNPFADTLTNSYDQVARAGVVDVKSAFTTTNASHHAVSGQRYKYRFSTRAAADAWTAAKAGRPAVADSEIAYIAGAGHTAADGSTIPATSFDNTNTAGNSGETVGLDDRTLFEAEKFVASYIPLGATQSVADNSVLHCGDCHTVGQFKAGVTTNAAGDLNTVVIGAHGSANDYLLRNSLGTDALHSSQTYVCFNCHIGSDVVAADDALWAELVADGEISSTVVKPTWRAGWGATHPNVIAGQVEKGYTTAHAVSAFHAQCQADSSNQVGSAGNPTTPVLSRVWFSTGGGHKDRNLDFVPASGATASLPTAAAEGGNITGIACTNCHNSGLRSSWGGIHGGDNTYTDGLGRTQKTYRFMPGMGNYRYAPPGGWNGKDVTTNTALVTLPGAGVGANKPMGGCYTNSAADANNGFSSCAHHGTSTTVSGGLTAIGWPAGKGGGTASSPTAAEPTVREATAGGVLVTRPLNY